MPYSAGAPSLGTKLMGVPIADSTLPPVPVSRPVASVSSLSVSDFAQNGFLSVQSITTADDIALIRSLLDPLFERFDSLGERAVDLAGPHQPGGRLRSPEVNEAVILEPRLRQTRTYECCQALARTLLGVPVGYQFDHAIFKPPHNETPTPWHQDEAYSCEPIPLRSVHFWIPLQPVTEQNGCMWFVPGSNLGSLLPHYVASRRSDGTAAPGAGGTLATEHVDVTKAVSCPLPVGGATVHHPLTLHYTGANQSDEHRKAWILHFGAYGWLRRRLHPKVLADRIRKATGRCTAQDRWPAK
jgi:hypothetical protein